jgi:two-component system, NtrC family, sensor kinase
VTYEKVVSTNNGQPSVLVVDDERANLDAFRRVFRHQFYMHLCHSPQDALDILKNESFDLIVADHAMPDMTGVEFLEAARTLAPDTGRMIVTGYPDLPEVRDAGRSGLTAAIIVKPWKQEEISNWAQHFYIIRHPHREIETLHDAV